MTNPSPAAGADTGAALPSGPAALPALPTLHWTENGLPCSAPWRSERGALPPRRVVLADDTTTADAAYRLACEGTALLWRGDFFNARQLLQALARRIEHTPERKKRAQKRPPITPITPVTPSPALPNALPTADTLNASTVTPPHSQVPANAFHLHRQAQAQRARVLGMVLLPFGADYQVALRRAPDTRQACAHAWGEATAHTLASVASLRDLLGMTSALEWRKNGVAIAALGPAPHNRIYPHYGVFSPVRGEYVDLVAQAPWPVGSSTADTPANADKVAFDIGIGSGVLAAVLARQHGAHVVGTDQSERALQCAQDNITQLGLQEQVQVLQADLFPPGRAQVVVCNPPWLPARPSAPVEFAVYDEGSRMLLGFLAGLADHLLPGGEGWLVLSDLAEHLGLRSRAMLLDAFAQHGLQVLGRLDARAQHPKASRGSDALHAARSAEVTSLWRLGVL
jgi:SAM-dependent methyltransferase